MAWTIIKVKHAGTAYIGECELIVFEGPDVTEWVLVHMADVKIRIKLSELKEVVRRLS